LKPPPNASTYYLSARTEVGQCSGLGLRPVLLGRDVSRLRCGSLNDLYPTALEASRRLHSHSLQLLQSANSLDDDGEALRFLHSSPLHRKYVTIVLTAICRS
jgi:hypothetical protein